MRVVAVVRQLRRDGASDSWQLAESFTLLAVNEPGEHEFSIEWGVVFLNFAELPQNILLDERIKQGRSEPRETRIRHLCALVEDDRPALPASTA